MTELTDFKRIIYEPEVAALNARARAAESRLQQAQREAGELASVRAWYVENFSNDEDEPYADDMTASQMMEKIFKWGDGAWAQAGSELERAGLAESRLRTAETALREIRNVALDAEQTPDISDGFVKALRIIDAALGAVSA